MTALLRLFIASVLLLSIYVVWNLFQEDRVDLATHPTLVASKLVDLIPIEDFHLDEKAKWGFQASSDGEMIAWRGVRDAASLVYVSRVKTPEFHLRLTGVENYFWHPTKQLLNVIADGRLWQIDPNQPAQENWVDITPRGFSQWSILNTKQDSANIWVVSSRDRNPAFRDLYTTGTDGRHKKLLFKNEGKTLNWIVGKEQEPQMRFDKFPDGKIRVFVWNGSVWRMLFDVASQDKFQVHEVNFDLTFAYALSSRGRDKVALVKVDLGTGQETVLAEDETADISHVINIDGFDGLIDYAISFGDKVKMQPLSPKGHKLDHVIREFGPKVYVNSFNPSGAGRFMTVEISNNIKSYETVLIDLKAGSYRSLGKHNFRKMHLTKMAETEQVFVEARDGLVMPAILTRPKGVVGPVPTIIEIHGGPANQEIFGYDHTYQFLANRGYAILALNFRGSSGLGKKFQEAGFGEFGRKMQDDIVDAAKWAVEQGIADPDNLAVMGGSYGGYSAAMAVLRDPGLFKVAIIEHAMLDLPYQMINNPHAWGLSPEKMIRYFGNPEIASDLEVMKKYSPINLIENLTVPVLIIAGKKDKIVGFEQSEEFIRLGKLAGKDIESLIFDNEGHGVSDLNSATQYLRKIETFLATHLGGRQGT